MFFGGNEVFPLPRAPPPLKESPPMAGVRYPSQVAEVRTGAARHLEEQVSDGERALRKEGQVSPSVIGRPNDGVEKETGTG